MKNASPILFILIIFFGCNTEVKYAESADSINLTPCAKYNNYYDTLTNFIGSLTKGSSLNFEAQYDTFYIGRTIVKDLSKWRTLPFRIWGGSEYEGRTDVKGNILALLDTLKSIPCEEKRDLSFAHSTIRLIDEDLNAFKQKFEDELKTGMDYFMNGVKITYGELITDENLTTYINFDVINETSANVKSIEIAIKYCDTENSRRKIGTQELMPECYQLALLKGGFQHFSTTSISIPLDQSKFDDRHSGPSIEITKIVKEDGTLVKRQFNNYVK